jgi:plastocyanin
MKRLAAATLSIALLAGSAAVPALAGTTKVKVGDDFFSPKSKTVSKGAKVTFVWTGKAPHNVTGVTGPATFRSAIKTKGSYTRTFKKAGTYRILCTIHAGMKMTLKVRR